jgi:hypothetical protein
LAVIRRVVTFDVVFRLERASPLEVTCHPAYGVLQHFAHLARAKLTQLLPDELALLFAIRSIVLRG